MSEENFLHRIENIEKTINEIKKIIIDFTISTTRHNEIIIDLKDIEKRHEDQIKDIVNKLAEMTVEISNLKIGFNAIKWLASSVLGTAIVITMSYLLKQHGI